MSKKIPLTQGKFTIVDDEDFERLSKFKWYFHGRYAARTQNRQLIRMHRFILNTPKGKCSDHINGDGLDNRKSNLRICTQSDNVKNRGKSKNNKSGLKGVSWDRPRSKWYAQIMCNRKKIHIGLFESKEEAHRAYKDAEKKYFGAFVRS